MRDRLRVSTALVPIVLLSLLAAVLPWPTRRAHADAPDAGAIPSAGASSEPSATPETLPRDHAPPRCREQHARPELIRSNYISAGGSPEEARRRRDARAAALRFRTEHYGYFAGFGEAAWNAHPPMHYATATRFMGLSVRVNARVAPALACVEREIARRCSASPYRPAHLVGIRPNNSFRGGEVSNHVYGIALDVDPDRNPCCGCGGHFAEHPGCRRSARTPYERMAMPECWVHAFEKYGFYWLGNDRALRDLMHFEFLGDPDRIEP